MVTPCRSGGTLPQKLSLLLEWVEKIGPRSLLPNPLREPPEAVVSAGSEDIRKYYGELLAEGHITERRDIKVVIIGSEGAGKTR